MVEGNLGPGWCAGDSLSHGILYSQADSVTQVVLVMVRLDDLEEPVSYFSRLSMFAVMVEHVPSVPMLTLTPASSSGRTGW